LFYGLFNDAVSNRGHIASDGRMTGELWVWRNEGGRGLGEIEVQEN